MTKCKNCGGEGQVNDFSPLFKKELNKKTDEEKKKYKKMLDQKNIIGPHIIKRPCTKCVKTGDGDLNLSSDQWEKVHDWLEDLKKWEDVTANTPSVWVETQDLLQSFEFDRYIESTGFSPPFEQHCSKKFKSFIFDKNDGTITGIGKLN